MGGAIKNQSIDSFTCSPPRKSLTERRKICFLCLRRMSSPPVGLVQWLSDITSNPQPRQRRAMSWKGFAIDGGAPSRQLRRGIEPRLHKLRQKKKHKTQNQKKQKQKNASDTEETCAVDQLRTPSARKPHDGNKDKLHKGTTASSNPGNPTHRPDSPRN